MENKKISPDRWQALYGPVPQGFDQLVQQTLKKTREAPVMKRFTLRTALVMLICLLLLTGIALAATGVFSTKNSLDMYTSAPSDGSGVDMQTDLHQTGGDFPDLTVTVRDAVYDGVTAYVTVEYKLKHPEKDMILSVLDTFGWPLKEYGRWPGYHERPLTDPKTDPRRKLVVEPQWALVYGINNISASDAIYESDGVLVITYRIRLDSEDLFEVPQDDTMSADLGGHVFTKVYSTPEPDLATMNPPQPETDWTTLQPLQEATFSDLAVPTQMPKSLMNVLERVAADEPLELTLKAVFSDWPDSSEDYRKKLYGCDVGVTLKKSAPPTVCFLHAPIAQGEMTLTYAKFTFTKLATYADIQTTFAMGLGTNPEDGGELGPGLAFEWLDDQGCVVQRLGESISGTYDEISIGSKNFELNRYVAFWPAVQDIPNVITLRAYSVYTDERLATFTIPLVPSSSSSPNP